MTILANMSAGQKAEFRAAITASGGAINRQAPVIAVIGDSRAAPAVLPGTQNGGVTTQKRPYTFASWLEALSGGQVRCPTAYNKAVAGSLVSDLAGQLANVLALDPRPDALVILSGTNTFNNSVTAADAWTDYEAVIATATNAGLIVFCVADLPRALSDSTAAKLAQSSVFNTIYLPRARALGAFVVDATYLLANAASVSGDPLSTKFYDGLHPATLGAYTVGNAVWSVMQTVLPSAVPFSYSRADIYHASNNPNGNIIEASVAGASLMQGAAGTNTSSGGVASGTVPSGYNNRTLSGTGTSVASIVARADGKPGNWLKLVQTSAGSASDYRLSLITAPPAASYYGVGDKLQLALDVWVESATGLEQLQVDLIDYDGAAQRGFSRWGASQAGYPYPAFAGRPITDPVTIIASPNSLLVQINTRVSSGAATLYFGGAELRRV